MYSEYDIVIAKRSLEGGVPQGSKGTILIVYENEKDYEVEFVDDNGDTINVITVTETDIEKV